MPSESSDPREEPITKKRSGPKPFDSPSQNEAALTPAQSVNFGEEIEKVFIRTSRPERSEEVNELKAKLAEAETQV
jgi:signal recognition particle GTPase